MIDVTASDQFEEFEKNCWKKEKGKSPKNSKRNSSKLNSPTKFYIIALPK